MAEQISNGALPPSGDVEMKEEPGVETDLNGIQEDQSRPDLTDPNPAPQPSLQSQAPTTEHLSTITAPPTAIPSTVSNTTGRPGSVPPAPSVRPEKPVAHGGPTRQYLNQNVTPHLLEAMKHLAIYEPDKPLQWLADFLRDRSKEVEG